MLCIAMTELGVPGWIQGTGGLQGTVWRAAGTGGCVLIRERMQDHPERSAF